MLREIRIHGRGGQGVVTLSELIALTAYYEGLNVQAFPYFGVERRGAPIESYVRISDRVINRRDQIEFPDYLIILDSTLLSNSNIFKGLENCSLVLINSEDDQKLDKYFIQYPNISVKFFNATDIGIKYLGKPIFNTAILGALAAVTGLIGFNSAKKALQEKFSGDILEKNTAMLGEAYNIFSENKVKIPELSLTKTKEVIDGDKVNIIS